MLKTLFKIFVNCALAAAAVLAALKVLEYFQTGRRGDYIEIYNDDYDWEEGSY